MKNVKFKYDFMKYNQFGVLRPSLLLILILCFLCKDFFMVLIVGLVAFKSKGGGGGLSDLIALVSPTFFFADLPVIVLLFAIGARRPDGGKLLRIAWHNGRYMILLSITIYSLILISLRGYEVSNFSLLDWIVIALNLAIVGYVFSSQFIKDTFAEFPEHVPNDNASKSN
jgi:hypothetical protein